MTEHKLTWRWSPILAAVWPTLDMRESNLAKLSNNPSTPVSSCMLKGKKTMQLARYASDHKSYAESF